MRAMTAQLPAFCLLLAQFAHAQTPVKDPDIVTDRPDITESAIMVPPRSLQFENGMAWTLNHSQKVVDISETLVRLGVTSRT